MGGVRVIEEKGVVLGGVRAGDEAIGARLLLGLGHLHADEGDQVGVLGLDVDDLGLSSGKLGLELAHLLLELADGPRATVHRVSDPRVGLVYHAANRVGSLALW